ncbi:hypothetical protein OEIGOIKO_05991 [Streptomyces chrestomyceticus JCM 4735]|uniref:Uncharacterized protein n=1 Tax=Streptomyces chrestomyceticus JCM 4735 TaxID=1306181 RepID=A0A7U9Q0S3_9ACTN|nr:DUF6578 domain-containing protein [Streptomyces chrestomyceticus]GCD38180.1 hypothetical protein OEIGOIKO_05991 [Streptomyces chrestomyceticus JCM 4735]
MTDTGAGRTVRVFHRGWEMECCGTPFSVGDEVAWPLVFESVPEADVAVWADCLDERGLLRTVTLHGGAADKRSGASRIAGRVRSIQVVVVGYRGAEPVPGERWLRSVERCPKWFADPVEADGDGGGAGTGTGTDLGAGKRGGGRERRGYRRVESGVLVELDVTCAERGA